MRRNGEVVDHTKFQELAALAATGQVSAEDYAALVAHLEVCPTCKEEHGDFEEILHGQLPLLHSELAPPAELRSHARGSTELKERFFARAQAEGLPIAPAVPLRQLLAAKLRLVGRTPAFAYAAALVLFVVAGFSAYQWRQESLASQARLSEIARLNKQNADLRQQLSDAAKGQDSRTAEELSAVQARNAALTALYDAVEKKLQFSLVEESPRRRRPR